MHEQEKEEHDRVQQAYFDERVDFFKNPIPPDVQDRTRSIITSAKLNANSRVLDVATGTGVLIEHFLAAGVKASAILGCDLSSSMLAEARTRYPAIKFWHGDFLDLPPENGPFDAIFFNACFGNFHSQTDILDHAVQLLATEGRIVISHPLGAGFVRRLNEIEPEIVPHLLPIREKLSDWAERFALSVEQFQDQTDLYIAALKRPDR